MPAFGYRATDETRTKMRAAWVRRRARQPSFWDRVDASGDCWLWAAGRHSQGYGLVQWNGRTDLAHRVAYALLIGPIPDGLQLDHLCRNPPCVNPDHLEPVTNRENIRRSPSVHPHYCRRGHVRTPETTTRRPDRPMGECKRCLSVRNRAARIRRSQNREAAA